MKIIVLDTETTGLNPDIDELLQVSIIDDREDILFNSYIKPKATEWPDAQRVNGITPELVSDAPTIEEVRGIISTYTACADVIIGYNGGFDLDFLRAAGCEINPDAVIVDVMDLFSAIYGEWSDYFGSYKWQKLSTCAAYYGYKFKAHDSLEDCKATLACYHRMLIEKAAEEARCCDR